jgi:glycosyltransferase involved in cell wall biosynthesis
MSKKHKSIQPYPIKIIKNENIYISNNSSIVYNNCTIKDPALSKYKKMLPHLSPDLDIYPNSIEEIFNARQIYISDSKISTEYIKFLRPINETEEEKYKKRYSENETFIDSNRYKKRKDQYEYCNFCKIALDEILIDDYKINYENKPMISVVIPSYNKQDILLKSVRSIQNQNFKNIEIIIVNDCSNDNSTEVFNYLLNTDPRIRIIHHKTNLGLWRTHLDGILYSKGQYIILFDAGDLYEDNYVLTDAYNVVEKYNLDSCKFIFRIIRSFKGLNKSEEYFHVENNETIAYGPDKVRKLNRKIFTFWGNIWTRLVRANILIKGILLMNDLTLNLHKNLWDDIWLNKIVNMASFSFAVLGRTGYVYLQNGGGEGSPKSGSIEQKSKKVKEYVGFLYFEYNFHEHKNSYQYIIDKLKKYNETDPILQLQNFRANFEVLNNLLNALIKDPELNNDQRTYCQKLLVEAKIREKNFTNITSRRAI